MDKKPFSAYSILIFLFIFACTICFAQTNLETRDKKSEFSLKELQEDFQQMRQTLQENHADLYEYTNKETFDKLFEQQYNLITQPTTLNEFFKLLTPITARIGCGHTNLWMPDEYWNSGSGKLFPLQMKLIEGYAVVTGDFNSKSLVPVGSIVLEINGISINDIIEEMKINYSADALNENLILDLRGNDGGDPFCAAPLFSYLEHEPVPYFVESYGKYSQLAEPIPLAENRFTGNLFTLIDGRCNSTNGHFCSLLKYHKIGKFVGTEGGATYKCNAGKNTQIHLKNTRIMLFFGRSTYAAAVEGMDKTQGILPDYTVVQTYRDFLDGKDTVLEYTFELIESLKTNKQK